MKYSKKACETLVIGLVISQLEYANSLYIGLPDCDVKKLQRVQNIAAKTVLNNEEKPMTCLKKLHWLPVSLKIRFKVLTLVYKSLGQSLKYLKTMLELHTPERTGMRSERIY